MISSGKNFQEVKVDWNEISETEFFQLGNWMTTPINLRIGKKTWHRWGIRSCLWKNKNWRKFEKQEINVWEDFNWRVITSYFRNLWRRWYSHGGKTMSMMATLLYPKGDGVFSTRDVQRKIAKMIEKLQSRAGYKIL